MGGNYSHTTRASGTLLTATIYNVDHVNHITNLYPLMIDDHAADLTQMRALTDPYPAGTAALPTSLGGDLERLRYLLKKLTGWSQWYTHTERIAHGGQNWIRNASLEAWSLGVSSAPDGWELAGAGASVARDDTHVAHGSFSAALTRDQTNCQLYQDVSATLAGGGADFWGGKTVTFSALVRATVANRARLYLSDGVSAATFSNYHTGGSAYELLQVTKTLDGQATRMEVGLQVDTGGTTAQIDAASLTYGASAAEFTTGPSLAGCRLRRSAVQSIPNSALTPVVWTVTDYDTHGMHSAAPNPSRLTIRQAGVYLVTGSAVWASNGTGARVVSFLKNGATAEANTATSGAVDHIGRSNLTLLSAMDVGDYLEMQVWQDSGGALNLDAGRDTFVAAQQVLTA